ncbi:alpha/beta hydrolase family protein [Sphingobium sp. B11D3B]|uniref:alpha/beta hydrolase family protein n=1 Tax=Sphingobium sp. B11D3B TaxID=2940575 RepID=UPI00222668DE|nr:S9 family peptidase [Sphingobium sp. B11D3B]
MGSTSGSGFRAAAYAIIAAALLLILSPQIAAGSTENAPAAARAPLPTEAFAALPFVEKATLSPDGTHIAGLFAVNGGQMITILPVAGDRANMLRFAVPDLTEVAWIRWVGNDHILVGVYALAPVEGSDWYVSRLLSVNRTTGKITYLMWDSGGQDAASVIWAPTDGRTEILVAAQDSIYTNYPGFWPSVYRLNVANGRRVVVEKGRTDVFDWGADSQGRVRMAISYNDLTVHSRLLYRAEKNDVLRTIDTANLGADEDLTVPFYFVPGSDNGYVLKAGDAGHRGVFEVDLSTGKTLRTIFDREAVDDVILAPDDSSLLGVRTTSDDAPFHWFDAQLKAYQEKLQQAAPDTDVEILSMSADRKKMLVRFGTPDNPGLLYYFDPDNGNLAKLAEMNSRIGTKRLARSRYVQYKARDGLEIEGVLTMPRGKAGTNLPFIVMPHGGPWAHDTLTYDYWVQFLAERGYAVLQPNFRGSTGYGDAFEKAGEGQMGLAMQDDVTDGVLWAVKEGIADPKRVCIVGASYGGYAAMWGIAKDPDFYRCAISINGVSNVRKEVNDFGGKLRTRLYRGQWQRMSADFRGISPVYAVDKIKTPLLLIHGKKDVTVDHAQSARMHSAMTSAGKQVEFVSVPLADHYFTREADRLTLLRAMEDFLAKHNPAD